MDKHLLSVVEAARQLGLGRSKTYDLVLNGEIASIKIGRSRRILPESLDSYINRLLAEQTGGTSDQSDRQDATN